MTVCPVCLDKNESPLVLCPTCERLAQESRKRAGLPVRFAKVLHGGEEPSD